MTPGYLYAVENLAISDGRIILRAKIGYVTSMYPIDEMYDRYGSLLGVVTTLWLYPTANAQADEKRVHRLLGARRFLTNRELFDFQDLADFTTAILQIEWWLDIMTGRHQGKPPAVTDLTTRVRPVERAQARSQQREVQRMTQAMRDERRRVKSAQRIEKEKRRASWLKRRLERLRERTELPKAHAAAFQTFMSAHTCAQRNGYILETVLTQRLREVDITGAVNQRMADRGFKRCKKSVGGSSKVVYMGLIWRND